MTAKRRRDGWGCHPESGAGRINALLMTARGPVAVADVADVEALGHRASPGDYLCRLARDGFVRWTPGGYEVTRAGRLLWRCAARESGRSEPSDTRGKKK